MFQKIDAALLARQFIRAARPSAELAAACLAEFGAAPTIVPVQKVPTAKALHCFWNVDAHAAEHGGAAIFGWAIFEWPHLFWEAQHHAVWRDPAGQLIDITPPAAPGTRETLFVEDAGAFFDIELDGPQDTHRFPLVDWQELDSYSRYKDLIPPRMARVAPAKRASDRMLCNLIKAQKSSKEAMLVRLANHLGPLDRCFCGSEKEFGSCCRGAFR